LFPKWLGIKAEELLRAADYRRLLRFQINDWESLRAAFAERLSDKTFAMLLSGIDRTIIAQ